MPSCVAMWNVSAHFRNSATGSGPGWVGAWQVRVEDGSLRKAAMGGKSGGWMLARRGDMM